VRGGLAEARHGRISIAKARAQSTSTGLIDGGSSVTRLGREPNLANVLAA